MCTCVNTFKPDWSYVFIYFSCYFYVLFLLSQVNFLTFDLNGRTAEENPENGIIGNMAMLQQHIKFPAYTFWNLKALLSNNSSHAVFIDSL